MREYHEGPFAHPDEDETIGFGALLLVLAIAALLELVELGARAGAAISDGWRFLTCRKQKS